MALPTSSSVLCAVIGEFLWNVAINVTVGLGSSDSAEAGPGQAIKRRLALSLSSLHGEDMMGSSSVLHFRHHLNNAT